LIQKAAKFLAAIENGEDVSELKSFLKKELVEVTPSVLHGKSWEQRSQRMITNKNN